MIDFDLGNLCQCSKTFGRHCVSSFDFNSFVKVNCINSCLLEFVYVVTVGMFIKNDWTFFSCRHL